MDAIKKDRKNSALWSFILGLVGLLLIAVEYIISRSGWFILELFLTLSLPIVVGLQLTGLFLGVRGLGSSKRILSILGIGICIIGLTIFISLIILIRQGIEYFFLTTPQSW